MSAPTEVEEANIRAMMSGLERLDSTASPAQLQADIDAWSIVTATAQRALDRLPWWALSRKAFWREVRRHAGTRFMTLRSLQAKRGGPS